MSAPPTQSQPMPDQERLERLLALWEKEPSVMLFGPGTNVCGKVAGWIRADHATLKARIEELDDFRSWVETWVSNPVGAYSVYALDGLFKMTRDKLAALQPKDAS